MSRSNLYLVSTSFSADAKWILPDTAIERILLGLPAIDLVFFKRVCTYWRSLISSADFVSAHLHRSKSDPSTHCLIVQNDFALSCDSPPPGPFKSFICLTVYSVLVVGSVNGLICIAGTSTYEGLSAEDIVIFNPSTGLSKKLPTPSKYRLKSESHMVKFAFWCHDDGVYKVAKIYSNSYSENMMVEGEVWDSSIDTWSSIAPILGLCISKRLGWVSGPNVLIEQGSAAYAYWIADCNDDMFVLSLDLKNLVLNSILVSKIQELLSPDSLIDVLNGLNNNSLIGASIGGNFVFLQNNLSNDDDGMYDVWMMGLDGEGDWNKNSQFHLDFPFEECLNCVNGKLLLRGLGTLESLAMYDMETRMKDLFEFKSISAISAHDFVGSLVSIPGFEYNVEPNAVIDVSWPYSFGSASSERRTGRLGKIEGEQSMWKLVLEQEERNMFLSKLKRSSWTNESEEKEKEIRVLKKRIEDMEVVLTGIEKSMKEFEKKMMKISTLESQREENVLAEKRANGYALIDALKHKYQMVVGFGGSSVAAVAMLGGICYIQVRKRLLYKGE